MFKRLFWLTIGMAVGFGTSFWLMRAVRQTIERYGPDRLARDATDAVRSLAREVREALGEGRDEMRQREESLRAEYGRRVNS